MQACPLPIDIFRELLLTDNKYVPVKSFIALRSTCRQMRKLYSRQRYIEKYGQKVTTKGVHYINNFGDMAIDIQIATYLPNKKLHGESNTHTFIYCTAASARLNDSPAGSIQMRTEVALAFGLGPFDFGYIIYNYYYYHTHTVFYYLGNAIGPSEYTCSLLGSNLIFMRRWDIDESLEVYWLYNGYYDSIGPLPKCAPSKIGNFLALGCVLADTTEMCYEMQDNRLWRSTVFGPMQRTILNRTYY